MVAVHGIPSRPTIGVRRRSHGFEVAVHAQDKPRRAPARTGGDQGWIGCSFLLTSITIPLSEKDKIMSISLDSASSDWIALQENVPATFGDVWMVCLVISVHRKPMLERMLTADIMGVPIRL